MINPLNQIMKIRTINNIQLKKTLTGIKSMKRNIKFQILMNFFIKKKMFLSMIIKKMKMNKKIRIKIKIMIIVMKKVIMKEITILEKKVFRQRQKIFRFVLPIYTLEKMEIKKNIKIPNVKINQKKILIKMKMKI